VLGFAQQQGLRLRGLVRSTLLGPKGNAEFLVWLGETETDADLMDLVDKALQ
jgi:hypothetical protein